MIFVEKKNADTIVAKFKDFLNEVDYKINILECDEGCEFVNKKFKDFCKNNNIELKLFNKKISPNAVSVVERVNKTMRTMISDYIAAYNTKKFYDVYEKLVKNYNNRIHSSTNIKPSYVNDKQEKNIVLDKIFDYGLAKANIEEKFSINEKVRILKQKKQFAKGEKESYSKKIYTIIKQDGNYFIVKSGNVQKSALPYQLKKIEKNIIENPFINKESKRIVQKKEKQILNEEQKKRKQKIKLQREGLL